MVNQGFIDNLIRGKTRLWIWKSAVQFRSLAEIRKPSRKYVWDRKLEKSVAKVNPDNLQKILDHIAPQHKLKILFAVETGLRIGERSVRTNIGK